MLGPLLRVLLFKMELLYNLSKAEALEWDVLTPTKKLALDEKA